MLLTIIVTAFPAFSDERTWWRDHTRIESGGELIAEFTYIRTSDRQFPFKMKYLYQGEDGELLVMRYEATDEEDSYLATYKYLGTDETLTIETIWETSLTIVFGADQVVLDYDEVPAYIQQHDNYPPHARAEAAVLLANISPSFREVLHGLAAVGSYDSSEFCAETEILNVFFDDFDFELPIVDKTLDATGLIEDFNPQLHPPDEFDRQFGAAYYE